jgi:hypothetical protein
MKTSTAALLLLGSASMAWGCEFFGASDDAATDPGAGGAALGSDGAAAGTTATGGSDVPDAALPSDFTLRAEFEGPCAKSAGAIDVNLGNAPEQFVRATYCQVNGVEPPADVTSGWADKMRTLEYVRRVDVVRTLCQEAGNPCKLAYSDPWAPQIPLTRGCTHDVKRDLGAVLMFFSDCPIGVNCGMDWANTHAIGMNATHPLMGFDTATSGYYNPKNAGFWNRELLDARYAGLQFLLLNVYGPDLGASPAPLAQLGQALAAAGPDVKIGLFDDTWAWGQSSSTGVYGAAPNLSDTEGAAQTIYQAKWKPFFSGVARASWYLYAGRPFISFYNAGTLRPRNVSAAVIARMKQLFQQDFSVEPFVAVDTAYFEDANMPNVADSEFTWDTFRTKAMSQSTLHGVTLDHFMVKRDSLGRDRPGAIAAASDLVVKGTTKLGEMLAASADADIAIIATWNDLGEGTGIERNMDYYFGGEWRRPDAFMQLTRAAQCAP